MMHLIKVGSETVAMKIAQSMANLHGRSQQDERNDVIQSYLTKQAGLRRCTTKKGPTPGSRKSAGSMANLEEYINEEET